MKTASVERLAQRQFFTVNAKTILLSKSFDASILVASAASVAVGASQIIISMFHVMHLVAVGNRAREIFIANFTRKWIARDARARVVHRQITVLLFAASAANVADQSMKISILLLIAHLMQLAARESRAW